MFTECANTKNEPTNKHFMGQYRDTLNSDLRISRNPLTVIA